MSDDPSSADLVVDLNCKLRPNPAFYRAIWTHLELYHEANSHERQQEVAQKVLDTIEEETNGRFMEQKRSPTKNITLSGSETDAATDTSISLVPLSADRARRVIYLTMQRKFDVQAAQVRLHNTLKQLYSDESLRQSIAVPNKGDVVLDKGKKYRNHPGHKLYRKIIQLHADTYRQRCPLAKENVAFIVLNAVAEMGGRLLRVAPSATTGPIATTAQLPPCKTTYRVIPWKEACKKVQSALYYCRNTASRVDVMGSDLSTDAALQHRSEIPPPSPQRHSKGTIGEDVAAHGEDERVSLTPTGDDLPLLSETTSMTAIVSSQGTSPSIIYLDGCTADDDVEQPKRSRKVQFQTAPQTLGWQDTNHLDILGDTSSRPTKKRQCFDKLAEVANVTNVPTLSVAPHNQLLAAATTLTKQFGPRLEAEISRLRKEHESLLARHWQLYDKIQTFVDSPALNFAKSSASASGNKIAVDRLDYIHLSNDSRMVDYISHLHEWAKTVRTQNERIDVEIDRQEGILKLLERWERDTVDLWDILQGKK